MRPHTSPLPLALAALGLAACTGSIAERPSDPSSEPPGSPVGPADPARPGTPAPSSPGKPPVAEPPPPVRTGPPVATTRFSRLSHRQWENAVRDLLGLPDRPGLAARFRGDPDTARFDSNGELLKVDEGLRRDYREAAEQLAEQATASAAALSRLLPPNLPATADRARAFITAFGLRAYRRPLTAAEIDAHLALFARGPAAYGGADAFTDGVRIVLEAILQSPHFLYRTELIAAPGPNRQPLGGYEVAAKLAFALTATIPDAELLAAAGDRRLDDRANVRKQAERLLATPAAAEALEGYHAQLLRVAEYDRIEKDAKLFPEYVSGIGAEMRQETLLFTRDVVGARGGVRELLLSPHTFVTKRLAPVYGVAPPATGFQRATLPATQRAGLLTQLGFLAVNAHAREIDSIHRGVFVHDAILCTSLPPPAEGATLAGAKGTTNRQRITSVTGEGTCGGGCHSAVINPIGFAFEHYDALGRHRTMDNGQPVDASGTYVIDGTPRSFKDALELSAHIADSTVAHACYARHLLEFLHGRSTADGDEPLVHAVAARSRGERASIHALIVDLVTSDEFLTRVP